MEGYDLIEFYTTPTTPLDDWLPTLTNGDETKVEDFHLVLSNIDETYSSKESHQTIKQTKKRVDFASLLKNPMYIAMIVAILVALVGFSAYRKYKVAPTDLQPKLDDPSVLGLLESNPKYQLRLPIPLELPTVTEPHSGVPIGGKREEKEETGKPEAIDRKKYRGTGKPQTIKPEEKKEDPIKPELPEQIAKEYSPTHEEKHMEKDKAEQAEVKTPEQSTKQVETPKFLEVKKALIQALIEFNKNVNGKVLTESHVADLTKGTSDDSTRYNLLLYARNELDSLRQDVAAAFDVDLENLQTALRSMDGQKDIFYIAGEFYGGVRKALMDGKEGTKKEKRLAKAYIEQCPALLDKILDYNNELYSITAAP